MISPSKKTSPELVRTAGLFVSLILAFAILTARCASDPLTVSLNDDPLSTELMLALSAAALPTGTLPTGAPTGYSRWTEYAGNPIATGGSIQGVDRIYYPYVIKAGATYHLWYGDGSNTRYASSSYPDFRDAVFPAPVVTGLDATYLAYHPRVAYDAAGWTIGGTYYTDPFIMYYTDGNTWFKEPKVARSSNGSAWVDIGACTGVSAYNGGVAYSLSTLYQGGTTWKAYGENGSGNIQFFTSTNGLNWTGVAANILGAPYQDSWELIHTSISPAIVKSGGTYCLFYSSGMTGNDQSIGLATSTDGQVFTKSSLNPLFGITDGAAWRNVRTYTASLVQDGPNWLLYFSGRTNIPSVRYSIGYAIKTGSPY